MQYSRHCRAGYQQLNLCGGQYRMQWEGLVAQIRQRHRSHDSNVPTGQMHLLIRALINCAPVLAPLHVDKQQASQG